MILPAISVILLMLAGCAPPAATSAPVPDTLAVVPSPTSTSAPPTPTANPPTKAPAPTATEPEPYVVVTDIKPILGTWKLADSLFVRFDYDGTFRGAARLDELDTHPYYTSTSKFEDGRLVIQELAVSGVSSCGTKVGRYDLRLLDSGDLQAVPIKDDCAPRAGDTKGIYSRAQ